MSDISVSTDTEQSTVDRCRAMVANLNKVFAQLSKEGVEVDVGTVRHQPYGDAERVMLDVRFRKLL